MAHLDLETYSPVDLRAAGMFKYAEHPDAEILIVSFELNNGFKRTLRYKNPRQMEPLFEAIRNGETVTAHNSQFERILWEEVGIKKYGWPRLRIRWDCTAARAAALSLPRSLQGASMALGLPITKDPRGNALIRLFSIPDKNGHRTMPEDDPVQFLEFMKYCRQDVVVETALDKILPHLTPYEHKLFTLDYIINKRGVPVSVPELEIALALIDQQTRTLVKRCVQMTGFKPSQRDKLLHWLQDQGIKITNLQQATIEKILPSVPPDISNLLRARLEIAKAGTKKLTRMLICASADGKVRGSFWYHSASTGRWGSGGVQLHNLAKPDAGLSQDDVFDCLPNLELLYSAPLNVLSKCVRGFLTPPDDKVFVAGDYSAIEARVLAWLAQEEWLLEDYRNDRDSYKTMASKIYNKDYDDITDYERFFGKQTVLGAGFGMGGPKFKATCARFGMEVSDADAKKTIQLYRKSTPMISKFRRECEYRAIRCVMSGKKQVFHSGLLSFEMGELSNGMKILYWDLPSGRRMAYPSPRVESLPKWGKMLPTLIFKTVFRGSFIDEETYSGKLAENVTQAIARDILCDGVMSLEKAGHKVVMHVHDEAEEITDNPDIPEFERLMCQVRPWAKGLPLKVEAQVLKRYAK